MKSSMIAILAGAALASVAAADQVTLEFQGVASGRNARISAHGSDYVNVFSGSVIHNIDGLRTVTYCIDPDQWAQTGTMNFERHALDDALAHRSENAAKASAIAELSALAGGEIWNDGSDQDLASAYQIAIWEIVLDYDTAGGGSSLDLGHGEFRAMGSDGGALSSGVRSHYDDLVGALTFADHSIAAYEAYTSAGHQDFMTVVPTPGTAFLALAGFPLIGGRRRR
jgi:hypothetical protein